MLQQVVDLIVAHLPGRRGAVCMVDQASGAIEPRCFSLETIAGAKAQASRPAGSAAELPVAPVQRPRELRGRFSSAAASCRRRSACNGRCLWPASPTIRVFAPRQAFTRWASVRPSACRSITKARSRAYLYVDSQGETGPLNSQDLEVLTVLGLMVAAGIAQISLRSDVARERALRDRLARYNSPQVVEQIMRLAPRQEDEMLADEYEVSVLFADLTGFSAMAENWSAAEAVRVLNLVFERWTSNVFQRDGTLDKYIGDAVMAVFGAPLRQPDHADRAVATALAMQRTLEELNRSRGGRPELQLRVGINSGRVIAGDIGSRLHKSYTVIGDAVNVASRLETSVALPGQIVIGPATYEQARDHFVCEPLGEVQLRGKRQAVRAYRVVKEKE